MVLDDPLPPGHVTRRMRIASFAIKMAHLHCLHPWRLRFSSDADIVRLTNARIIIIIIITQQWIKLKP